MGKKGEPIVHKKKPKFKIGKSIFIKRGRHLSILGVGNALSIANECEEILRRKKISSDLISFHTPKPIDHKLLKNLFKLKKLIVVIEEHGLIGGVGSGILEWASDNGYIWNNDLEYFEEQGCIEGAVIEQVSEFARKRGKKQLGSLGSGNHFLEVQKVEEIYDERAAKIFGLHENQVVVMMHTGSRGCGHQVCQDHLACVLKAGEREGIDLPDKQLASAPLNTPEARNYLGGMSAAANFAWANRSLVTYGTRKAFSDVFGVDSENLGMSTLYDVSHNIAKVEKHKSGEVCVHRKGATRAFGPDSLDIPPEYREVGQPVIVPGDMGTCSYVLSGTEGAMEQTFGSTCHGAGRALGRKAALKKFGSRNLIQELWEKQRIYVKARSPRVANEEAPDAYKDVSEVVDVCHNSGIANKVAKLKPLGVVKG